MQRRLAIASPFTWNDRLPTIHVWSIHSMKSDWSINYLAPITWYIVQVTHRKLRRSPKIIYNDAKLEWDDINSMFVHLMTGASSTCFYRYLSLAGRPSQIKRLWRVTHHLESPEQQRSFNRTCYLVFTGSFADSHIVPDYHRLQRIKPFQQIDQYLTKAMAISSTFSFK